MEVGRPQLSIFFRIWLALALILALGGAVLLIGLESQIKPLLRQSVEDTLVDSSRLLAVWVAEDVVQGRVRQPDFDARIQTVLRQPLNARIWQFEKNQVRTRLYITDAQGRVLYDSTGRSVGADFSRWNDVYLTLRGRYGVRSTRSTPGDDRSSVMYVGAPIVHQGRLIGVLSLGKPALSVQQYLDSARTALLQRIGWALLLMALLLTGVALWVRDSLQRVRRYALSLLGTARQAPHFYLARELNELSASIAQMRDTLENRHYVERYVQTLTHELKSPLTAIAASAELLAEPLAPEDRQRLSDNVLQQSQRLHGLVERMLLLTRLENQRQPFERQPVDLMALLRQQWQSRAQLARQRQLQWQCAGPDPLWVQAEPFWLGQALGNVLDNALDFAPPGSVVQVAVQPQGARVQVRISNAVTAPLPDYVLARAFERYFSLPRRDGRKGSGIGLTLVAEVMQRHGGQAQLQAQGLQVSVLLELPVS